eukprot:1187616-Prorocentrum_minimum.AAC.7
MFVNMKGLTSVWSPTWKRSASISCGCHTLGLSGPGSGSGFDSGSRAAAFFLVTFPLGFPLGFPLVGEADLEADALFAGEDGREELAGAAGGRTRPTA